MANSSLRSPADLVHVVVDALHRRRTRWIVTAIIAVVTTSMTWSAIDGARSARTEWGRTTSVVIARHDLAPGHVITDDDVERVDRPTATLPDDTAIDAVGRTITMTVARGEAVLERRLAPSGTSGPDALLPHGALAFAVPTDHSTPPLSIGDRVDVFAPGTAKAVTATRAAHGAIVLSTADRSVTIGVDPAQAPALARALLDTTVVLALAR